MKLTVRDLTVKDFDTFTKLLKKLARTPGNEHIDNFDEGYPQSSGVAPAQDPTDADVLKQIYVILLKLIDELRSDVFPWFADLLDVDIEEFYKLPFKTPLTVVNQLLEKEDFSDFLEEGLRIFKKIPSIVGRLKDSSEE